MPIYEYRCQTCGRKTSILWRNLSAIDERNATCDKCGSKRLVRLVSRVRVVRGGGGSSDDLGPSGDADAGMTSELDNLDENDPRALGRFMRKMAQETGEDMGSEFEEVVGRLEKGEDPEKIEQSMGDMFGDDGMGGPTDMDDDYAAPEDTAAKADKEAEAKDKKTTEKRRTVAMRGKTNKARKKTGAKAKGRKKQL